VQGHGQDIQGQGHKHMPKARPRPRPFSAKAKAETKTKEQSVPAHTSLLEAVLILKMNWFKPIAHSEIKH